MFTYFFPIFGAIVSDSFLGKFRTILYVSMVYAAGCVLLALASVGPLHLPMTALSAVGLLLIAIGTGGIKPCVSAFGGDQFVLPDQEDQMMTYFSWFYFSINAGSFISTFLTPVLRNDVHCFDKQSCFPLAFGVPGALMIVSIVIFALGKPLYKIKMPKGNVLVDVSKCISYAISQKMKSKEKKDHWLDYAEAKFGSQLVNNIKVTMKVLVLYIPLPIFWTLYDQQGSGWTFQAVRMDGNIGFYTILPDQMQVVNPLLILVFIPIFTYGVYPVLAKCRLLTTPLQKMTCGGLLAAVAFAVSAILSVQLEKGYPVLPTDNNIQLRVYNPSPCSIKFESSDLGLAETIASMDAYTNKDIKFSYSEKLVAFKLTGSCLRKDLNLLGNLTEKKAYGIYATQLEGRLFFDFVDKSEDGYPRVRTLTFVDEAITFAQESHNIIVETGNYSLKKVPRPGEYSINGGPQKATFKLGGTYTVLIGKDNGGALNSTEIVVTQPNDIHILWLMPQYIIITAAEIMFSITGLEFSYSQAPVSMKSLLQACFLLTTAIGNLIIVIIESVKFFDKQSNDFFLYTALMVLDMGLFGFLAMRYKYVVQEDSETEELQEDIKESSNGIENPSFKTADANI
ncbi:unnamed protein product [Callosobruchus maculatus]|uniref:Oligopeptide transporter 1 n=1 Tax=Callosobruchus maculatus TaxID=64391 RepID=A0A653CJN9_CALMS|nr:unnamed protein product [Callosobruchus maculatus]